MSPHPSDPCSVSRYTTHHQGGSNKIHHLEINSKDNPLVLITTYNRRNPFFRDQVPQGFCRDKLIKAKIATPTAKL